MASAGARKLWWSDWAGAVYSCGPQYWWACCLLLIGCGLARGIHEADTKMCAVIDSIESLQIKFVSESTL